MKRQDWKKLIEEPVSRAAQDRMFTAADAFIDVNFAGNRKASRKSNRDWQAIVEDPVSREAQNRMFAAADRFIDDNLAPQRSPGWLERLFAPAFAVPLAGAAAAVALFFVISIPRDTAAPPEVARVAPELIQNLDLFLELETLESWEPGKQAKEGSTQWKKGRS